MVLFLLALISGFYIFLLPWLLLTLGIRRKWRYADLATYVVMLGFPVIIIWLIVKFYPRPYTGLPDMLLTFLVPFWLLPVTACGMFSTYSFCKKIFFPAAEKFGKT